MEEENKTTDQLAEEVKKRTAELIESNERLEREIAERRRAEAEARAFAAQLEHRQLQESVLARLTAAFNAAVSVKQVLESILRALHELGFKYLGFWEKQGDRLRWNVEMIEIPDWLISGVTKVVKDFAPAEPFYIWVPLDSENLYAQCYRDRMPHTTGDTTAILAPIYVGRTAYRNLPGWVRRTGAGLVERLNISEYNVFPLGDYGVAFLSGPRGINMPDHKGWIQIILQQAAVAIERQWAIAALRESEEKYRRVVENANEAIVVAQEGMLKFFNPKALEITGYSAGELASTPFAELIHPDDRAMETERHLKRLRGEQLLDIYSFRIVDKGGKSRWIETCVVTIDWEGKPATLNFISDITERRQVEEAMLHASRLQATATLAGGIAHDFNNLMTGVLGNAEMLKMDLADQEDQVDQPDRHDRIEMLAAISDSARRAAKLTQQLLAYARGGKYQPQVVDLNGIVQMILQAQARIAPSEIHVEVDAASDLWYIEADSAQMSEVVFNLFTNAVEAIESSGRIDIATGNRVVNEGEVADLEPGRYVCLSVRDTGRGMSEEAQSRLFEPFFTTKFQGRGMGLAAAYGIVTNHGGHIRVESEKGCGTTFEVYLPAIRTESAASPVEQPPHSQPVVATRQIKPVAEVLTILVIEDDETVRKLTTRLIGRFGYRALVARNGKEAVDIARSFEGDIHLALLDMGMPVMGGAETYPLLVAARPGIKVIIYSGYELDAAAQALLDAGASAFIQKPFQIGVLEAEIRKALAE